MFTEFPPLIKHFADKQNLFIDAVDATGRLSKVANQYLAPSRSNPSRHGGAAVSVAGTQPCRTYLIRALKLILVQPFDVDAVPKSLG